MNAVNRFQVPQELVDAILDCLWDEKNSLSACSLVSKSWSPRARRLLFRTLQLLPASIPQKSHEEHSDFEVPDWARFISDFSAMPAVAGLVEILAIFGDALPAEVEDLDYMGEILFGRASDGKIDPLGVNYVLLPLETLLSMVLPLSNLRHVLLRDLVLKPTSLLPLGPKILHSVSLERAGMLDGGDILDIFHVFKPETNVFFDVFWRPTGDSQEPTLTRTQRGLTAAHWQIKGYPNIHPILRGLLDSPFVTHVTSLDVTIQEPDELLALSELLQAVGSRLKSLKLNLFDAFWESDLVISLSRMCFGCFALAILQLTMFLSAHLREVWGNAASLASCASLEQLDILFRVGTSGEPFEDIETLLSTLSPSIRKVTIIIHFVHFALDRVEALPWHIFGSALRNYRGLEKVLFTLSGDGASNEVYAQIVGSIAPRLAYTESIPEVEFVSRGPYWPWEVEE